MVSGALGSRGRHMSEQATSNIILSNGSQPLSQLEHASAKEPAHIQKYPLAVVA